MKKYVAGMLALVGSVLGSISLECHGADEGSSMTPPTDAQVTMLYYKNLDEPTVFYGDVLGLKNTLDWDWVKFFQTSPTSYVGLVTEGEGAHHQVQTRNAVMVSIVTSDVDGWYGRISKDGSVVVLRELADRGPIRSFMLEDPGGYTVEFFQWLSQESN